MTFPLMPKVLSVMLLDNLSSQITFMAPTLTTSRSALMLRFKVWLSSATSLIPLQLRVPQLLQPTLVIYMVLGSMT